MKPVNQLIKHDPKNGQYGDCVRACVASIFEIPIHEIPNFGAPETDNDDGDAVMLRVAAFLKEREIFLIAFPRVTPAPEFLAPLKNSYCIGFGITKRMGTAHAVVCDGMGNILHDPDPNSSGLCEVVNIGVFVKLFPIEGEQHA